jgi:hypothetical protein
MKICQGPYIGKNRPNGEISPTLKQGCQMVCFQTKNPNLGKFWRVLQWKIMVYFMDTRSILRSLVIFYGHLVHIVHGNFFPFWNFVPRKIWQPCPGVIRDVILWLYLLIVSAGRLYELILETNLNDFSVSSKTNDFV